MRAAGVIAGEPHRLHDSFGAGHVERDFIEPRNRAQPRDVVGNDGVVGSEHGAERTGARLGAGNAFLVEVVAEDIDAIRTGQVVEDVAVEIGDRDPRRRLHERACPQMLPHQTAVLKRHAVAFGELQVGDSFRGLQGHCPAFGEPLPVVVGEPEETIPTLRGNLRRRAVGIEEIVDAELIERDQPRHQARHPGMSGQRAVLGPRQRQPRPQFGKDGGGAGDRGAGERQNRKGRIHDIKRYPVPLTNS